MSDARDVVIVGAGAGGLALAFHLKRAGVDFQVVERGAIGHSWRLMPEEVRLLSPWWANVLPDTPVPLRRALARVSSRDYADYLAQYARERALPVQEQCEVTGLARDTQTGDFQVDTTAGPLRARAVVCACGYFQNPRIPALPGGDDGSVPRIHAADYSSPAQLAKTHGAARRVVIVGKRITAGQIMVELHDAGHEVILAARGTVRWRAKWRKTRLKEESYFVYERLFVKLFPRVKAEERPIMDGGRTEELLSSGRVVKADALAAVRDGEVEFVDGRRQPCDLLLFATGYRPALGFLRPRIAMAEDTGLPRLDGMQSAEIPGLHFLGLENLRNFLSPYLRGVCADARVLAGQLRRGAAGRARARR